VGRFSGGGMRYVRFEKMLNEVLESVAGKNLNAVYFEEVRRHAGTDAAHVYGGLMAILTSWCEKHGIPYQGIPVGTIKKCATGKGNADKQAMIEAAKHAWPDQDIKDDNQADALWVLRSSDAVGL
jgi:Holliday junction resolvasome RuvABC endonuclease subunit